MGFLQPVVTTLSHILFSGPVHLLCFSSLLGTQLYQSFVITKVVFQALPRQPFTTLQARLFPVYFRLQTALLILTILTWPPRSLMSLVVSETSSKAHWIPLAVGLGAAVLNLVLFGPRARQIMLDMAQIGRERKPNDAEVPGPEMALVKKAFKRNHAASIHLNLITLGATLWHGWFLASKIQV